MLVAQNVIEEQKRRLELQASQLCEALPKARVYDVIVENRCLRNATQVGQKVGMSALRLNQYLEKFGVYSKSVKRGRVFKQHFIDDGFGCVKTTDNGYTQCLFTAAGEAWIVERLTSEGII